MKSRRRRGQAAGIKKPAAVLVAALAGALVLPGVAYADYVDNTLSSAVDSTLESMALTVSGTGSTTIYVKNQNSGDGDTTNSCNLARSSSITLAVSSSDATKATVSPSQITIDACGEAEGKVITVTGLAIGSPTISVRLAPGATVPPGNWTYETADFTALVSGPSDTSGPLIGLGVAGTLGNDVSTSSPDVRGWFRSDVAVDWTVTDGQSAISSSYGCDDETIATDGTYNRTCSATSAGGTSSRSVTVKRDATAPSATPASVTATTGDWTQGPVSQTFSFADVTSGLATNPGLDADDKATVTVSDESVDDVTPTSASITVYDAAGNSVTRSVAAFIDKTKPTNVQFVGGPADQGVYFPNNVPASPTCTADDELSGLNSCVVTGYSTGEGAHTLTATATDKAGNTETATVSYRVRLLSLNGFFQPVDMGANALNAAKSGSTVPLKFRVFDEGVEQTATSIVKSFKVGEILCGTLGTVTDDIEQYTSGSTSLRYDSTGQQFVQNWQTPAKKAGACYKVTMTTIDDSAISAYFKLR